MALEVFPKLPTLKGIEKGPAQTQALLSIIDSSLRPYLKNIPDDKTLIDVMIEFMDPRKPLPKGSYLLETSYQAYMDLVTHLAMETVTKLQFQEYDAYLTSYFSSSEDMMASGQRFMMRFPKMHKDFSEERLYTREGAEQDIGYYNDLAGHYEKSIALVVGLMKLLEGKQVDYPSMRKRQLSANLKSVTKREYSLLASLDKHIRNAIAHNQVILHPDKGSVTFYDAVSGFSSEYSYEDVRKKAKELAASVIALYAVPNLIHTELFISLRDSAIGAVKP
ncbi:MAG: hypothetical protein ACRKGH_03810 [Dehalogenimonas sp.]